MKEERREKEEGMAAGIKKCEQRAFGCIEVKERSQMPLNTIVPTERRGQLKLDEEKRPKDRAAV